jgi:hypothetical protein
MWQNFKNIPRESACKHFLITRGNSVRKLIINFPTGLKNCKRLLRRSFDTESWGFRGENARNLILENHVRMPKKKWSFFSSFFGSFLAFLLLQKADSPGKSIKKCIKLKCLSFKAFSKTVSCYRTKN